MAAKTTKITTKYRRETLAKITAGIITTMPKVTHLAFGDGGCDAFGEPLALTGEELSLKHEVARYPVTRTKYPATDIVAETGGEGEPISTAVDYLVLIPEKEHMGIKFSEMALVDEAGSLCGIINMYPKQKDVGVKFTFCYRDEFVGGE